MNELEKFLLFFGRLLHVFSQDPQILRFMMFLGFMVGMLSGIAFIGMLLLITK